MVKALLTVGDRTFAECEGNRCDIPPLAHGSLIVWNVDSLAPDRQRELLAWIDARRACVQVIAVTANELFTRVQRGEFLDALYYRVNTVRIDVEGASCIA